MCVHNIVKLLLLLMLIISKSTWILDILFCRTFAVEVIIIIIIFFLRPLAQSRRLNIKQLWLDMALTQIECARKRHCICLLDGNGKTLYTVIRYILLLLLLLLLSSSSSSS